MAVANVLTYIPVSGALIGTLVVRVEVAKVAEVLEDDAFMVI